MKTLKFNKFDNVIPLNLALADFDGLAKLFIYEREGREAPSMYSLVRTTDKFILTPCRRGNSLLEELRIKKVDWVKIDVEGAEYEVLSGMTEIMKNNESLKIIMELHLRNGELINWEKKSKVY